MLRSALIGASALCLVASANACACLLPPPLAECAVPENQAALLVTIGCVKSLVCDDNDGAALADITIDQVFQDNTNLGLSVGDTVTVRSHTPPQFCGIGGEFRPGRQWIMFAIGPDPAPPARGRRRLQQPIPTPNSQELDVDEPSSAVLDVEGRPSDGGDCDIGESDLRTNACAGNVIEPTQQQIDTLTVACIDALPVDIGGPGDLTAEV